MQYFSYAEKFVQTMALLLISLASWNLKYTSLSIPGEILKIKHLRLNQQ
jgi:hypothetical protein